MGEPAAPGEEPSADVLSFEGGTLLYEAQFDWRGAWPPPERIGLAVSTLTGGTRLVMPDEEAVAEELAASAEIEFTWYRRAKYSGLPPQSIHGLLRRGAKYEPEP